MSYRSILMLFSGDSNEYPALSTAFKLAETYGAHLTCLHVSPNPEDIVYPDLEIGLPLTIDITQEYVKANKERLIQAQSAVTSMASKHHIPLNPAKIPAHHASVSFVHITGAIDKEIAYEGKFCDIIVMGRTIRHVSTDYEAAVIAALFDTGRPVLFLPPNPPVTLDNTIAVAWNESKQSVRAVSAAMPLLKRSERICLFNSPERNKTPYKTQKMTDYFALYGLDATPMSINHEGFSIGLALMNRAKNLNVTLMVMGAFTHTRLQESVMGGVTKFMLDYAEIPVLMAH